jgi:cell division protein FtsB
MDLRVKHLRKIGPLPKPENGLRSLVEQAPKAEAWADRTMEKMRPTLTLLYSIRRRLATVAVIVFATWLFVHVMFGSNGMVVYRQKKLEYQELQKQIETLQKQNADDSQQIKALQSADPKAIEKEAREQLQYARPGEVIYVSPPPPAPKTPPHTNVARK